LEAVILYGIKVLHVLEYDTFPVNPRLAPEFQICLLPVSQLGLNNVPGLQIDTKTVS
jgi:hypothetical protein